jgi:2-methylisocitrate lyase-like PEP mutase family enzyme
VTSAPRRLRELLARDEILVTPGGADPMMARLVERAGFDAVYMTGAGTAMSRMGVPDVGLITMTEMVANAAAMANAVEIPLIADADTGYGNPLNVQRAVREYERAGVAAIHIEDQLTPKKCGHLLGKRLVSTREMEQKVRAACDARKDDDFVIIARTDALAVDGLQAALDRGHSYLEAGADVLFVESPTTMEEIRAIGSSTESPLLFNMASSGKTPFLSAKEVQDLGFDVMIFPNFTTLSAIKAARGVLAEIASTGSAAGVLKDCATFPEFMELAGLADVQKLERLYGLPEDAYTGI